MKYLFYMFILPIGLIAVFLFYSGVFDGQTSQTENAQQTVQETGGILQQWETKTDEQLPVTVAVTPVELGKNVGTWKFNIVFDTHSGSLDDDMLTVAALVDDRGNTYQPKTWEGAGPGGHHREGVLSFDAIRPAPSVVELIIRNVGGISERSFTWSLK